MVQALFALVAVSFTFPFFYSCFKESAKIESALNRSTAARVVTAVFLLLINLSSLDYLPQEMGGLGSILNTLLNKALNLVLIAPIHEFGHFLFMPLGQMLCILGGSLLQILVPLFMSSLFFLQGKLRLAGVWLCILAYYQLDVAGYMSSAQNPGSVLLLSFDQNPETHDWFNLFKMWGLLEQSVLIAEYTRFLAIGLILLGFVLLFLPREKISFLMAVAEPKNSE